MTFPASLTKDVGSVVRDDIDAVQLGESLCRHGNEHTLIVALEHLAVRPFAFLAREKHIHLDFTELITSAFIANVTASIKIGNDNNSFFVMVVVKKPPAAPLASNV